MIEKRIKELRERAGLNITELATRASLSWAHIYNLEKGVWKNPTLKTIQKVANAFKISVSKFLKE